MVKVGYGHAKTCGVAAVEGGPEMGRRSLVLAAACATALSLASCETPNGIALKIGAPPETAVKMRAMETRRYDTADPAAILTGATQTLQDLGFTISESQAEVGVVVGSKQRDAEEAGQVVAQVALSVAGALLGVYRDPDWDESQSIVVTVVATPVTNSPQIDVRTSFNRLVKTKNGLYRSEIIDDGQIYQQFFDKLSGGIFLQGHHV